MYTNFIIYEGATHMSIPWEHDLSDALTQAERKRRFIIADFSKDH